MTLSYLGRCEDLERALQEARGRELHGSSTELIAGATEALELMHKHPETSFRCGPLALDKLVAGYAFGDPKASKRAEGAIAQCSSTRKGTSLARVYQLSQECQMAYQMAFRSPGAPLVARAVMHWKAGHFGALVEKKGDRYLVEDSTSIATPLYVSADCLEQEGSGYFLIPAGPLPEGWRSVGLVEAQTVWGCGVTTEKDEDSTTTDDIKSFDDDDSCFMTRWNVHALLVGLTLSDTPVGLSPAQFAVPFTATYAHREANQPTTFTYSNLGNKWSFNFLSILTDNFATTLRCDVYQPGGGVEVFEFPSTNTSYLSPVTNTVLQRNPGVSFVMTGRDGSQRVYDRVVGNQYFMTKMIDPQGNTTSINFDGQNRITSVVDPSNRSMTFTYGLASDPLKITRVTDPFGRSATFSYNNGQLTSITDVIGLTSSYQYGSNDFIQALTTPYGTTQFAYADKTTDPTLNARRILTVVDPAGRNYRAEYRNETPGLPFSEPVVPTGMLTYNFFLDSRNSFAWEPNQLAGGTVDYTKATVTHFLHNRYNGGMASRTVQSIKKPNERRIWFFHYGSAGSAATEAPTTTSLNTHVGRVHSDGSTQLTRYEYNPQGNVTKIIDPTGRNLLMSYAPGGIDLTSVTTGGKTLMSATYDTHHNIVSLTSTSGGNSAFGYDARGLLTSATNPLGQTTSYAYTQTGNLASIQEPLQKTTTFSYDSAERVASATDSEGYTVQAAHDSGDRPTSVTYPDGTTDQLTYSRLDVAETRDRLGRTTGMSRDALGRLTSLTDANGGVTSLAYGLEDAPSSLTDPKGNTTNFQFDLQQRMIAKQFPGGATQSVIYEQCFGRIYRITDELGQSKTFSYFLDDQLKSITYSGNTPAVNFTSDTFLPRPLTMTDGTGTTSYTYGEVGGPGANKVVGLTGPYGDSATFAYDVADRPTAQTVNGSAENVTYDDLWRPTSTTNALDTFNMAYLGKTGQVTGVNSTLGPSTTYTYAPNAGDRRLTQIKNLGRSSDALSQFDYVMDSVGQITKLTETMGGSAGNSTDPGEEPGKKPKKPKKPKKGRDRTDRDDEEDDYGMVVPFDITNHLNGLIALTITGLWAGLLWHFLRRPSVGTSRMAQVTSLALISALALNGCIFSGGGGTTATTNVMDFTYDRLGQLVGVDLNQVAQERYVFDDSGNLTSLTVGNTTTSFAANNLNQQTTPGTHVYDAKGQKTTLDGKTFEWDDQGRVTAIVQGTTRSEFAYDGMSRRTKITELTNGTVTSKKLYWWLGGTIVCERDGLQTGFPITKRYFGQGVLQGATKLFYTFDHLGSVRELVDDAGTVQAQYRYSTYGERTKETGNLDSDWGYAGLWHHAPSGLDLATYRLYDAANKRWISRDPLGEGVDYNLYRYCGNAPIGKNDPAGLQPGAFVLTVNSARIDIDRNLIVDANLSILATPNRPIASPTVTVKVSVRRCGQWSVEYLKIHDYRSLADIGRQVLYPKNIEFPLNLSGDKWKDAEAIEVEMWADAVDVFLTPLGTRRFRKFFEF